MKRIISARQPSKRSQRRRGTAQIELTLFLPLYAAFLMVLFTQFSFARTKSQVAIKSRHQAWTDRAATIDQKQTLDVESGTASRVGKILNGDADPTAGLVTATTDKDATVYLKTMKLFTNLEKDHAVFSDPWDHLTMPFERQGDHSRLTLDRRAAAIAAFDLDTFATLISWKSGLSAIASQNSQLQQLQNAAMGRIQEAVGINDQKISDTKEQLSDLRQELSDLREAVPPDFSKIRDASNKIGEVTNRLRKLTAVADKLNEGANLVFGSSTSQQTEQ